MGVKHKQKSVKSKLKDQHLSLSGRCQPGAHLMGSNQNQLIAAPRNLMAVHRGGALLRWTRETELGRALGPEAIVARIPIGQPCPLHLLLEMTFSHSVLGSLTPQPNP